MDRRQGRIQKIVQGAVWAEDPFLDSMDKLTQHRWGCGEPPTSGEFCFE